MRRECPDVVIHLEDSQDSACSYTHGHGLLQQKDTKQNQQRENVHSGKV